MEDFGPTTDPYASLRFVLNEAFDQAASGKGRERHAGSDVVSFLDQPMFKIPELLNDKTAKGPLFQALKKLQEGARFADAGEVDKAVREYLGAIVYTAAAIIRTRDVAK